MKPLRSPALAYLFAVTATAMSFPIIYLIANEFIDGFSRLGSFDLEPLLGYFFTDFIICWFASSLWALPPLFIVTLNRGPASMSLPFQLSLAALFSFAASAFFTYFAPFASPGRTLISVMLSAGYWSFTLSVVTSALIGAVIYWKAASRAPVDWLPSKRNV